MHKFLEKLKGNQHTALLFCGFSLYYLLALGSFSPLDPSPYAVGSNNVQIGNLGGAIGAYIGGVSIYQLGLIAFSLPFLLAWVILSKRRWAMTLLLTQAVAVLLYTLHSYHATFAIFALALPSAGQAGNTFTSVINHSLGKFGAHILLATMLGYFILIVVRFPLPKFKSLTFKRKKKTSPPANNQAFKFATSKAADITRLQQDNCKHTATLIKKTLIEFKINGEVISWKILPATTVYEFQPQAGIKQTHIISLASDIALALQVDSVSVEPIPNTSSLGIQIPNRQRQLVQLGDILHSDEFKRSPSKLTFALGKGIDGQSVCANLQAMPHLLIAGSTGAGKSVAINSLLCSILSRATPNEVLLMLVDPKMLELSAYNGIPHLLQPVITDTDAAKQALVWACEEMQRRYEVLQKLNVKNVEDFRIKWQQLSSTEKTSLRNDYKAIRNLNHMPYIIFVIDELADLMLTAGKQIERLIQRLAQKARASGIHLVLATQRPSVDVITGVIKANLPCRIAFRVASKHDSRTILDVMGAEKLLGKGDMLMLHPSQLRPQRIQGTYVRDDEVKKLVSSLS
ncbi:MAG: DNA translocase FtsK 4TM domain-containing protein [Pseudomonadota bacterium]|nr:DNA translocase FtsK 4TM domain-containing protein [Pseudomonadota bacterium]